ncbi:MAG TPA: hypothetical protein VNG04_07930, partial [Candidatus Acidoferrum sp.]|nr:hypothetical protein [Candidatus Acidoferrum sp.]
AQIGSNLKCASGDHGFDDPQAGWGFCYPSGWKYNERSQASTNPPGLDLAFDITFAPDVRVPCPDPSASPVPSPAPASPCSGQFAFMIISTYERGSSTDLASWMAANQLPPSNLAAIRWGNAVQAARLPDGRRIALTQHHVVIMDLHSGLLDLETPMSARLDTWKFSF